MGMVVGWSQCLPRCWSLRSIPSSSTPLMEFILWLMPCSCPFRPRGWCAGKNHRDRLMADVETVRSVGILFFFGPIHMVWPLSLLSTSHSWLRIVDIIVDLIGWVDPSGKLTYSKIAAVTFFGRCFVSVPRGVFHYFLILLWSVYSFGFSMF